MFDFHNAFEGDMFKTLSSLIKFNNGQFKSFKQAQFILKSLKDSAHTEPTSVKSLFGVDMPEGMRMVYLTGYMRWADYGSRSIRPVSWAFVFDDQGVYQQFKFSYAGNLRDGTSINASKTKLLWTREEITNPLVKPEVPAVTETVSAHIGQPGEKIEFEGKVVFVKEFTRQHRFSYYDSGLSYITCLDVNGNTVVYFGNAIGEKGEILKIKATVKAHDVREGKNQTIISRPKVLDIVEATV